MQLSLVMTLTMQLTMTSLFFSAAALSTKTTLRKSFIKRYMTSISTFDSSHPNYNVSPNVKDKIGRNLHLQDNHPLSLTKKMCGCEN